MATTTYTWDIPQMNAHIEQFGEDNVIYTVHYRYTGTSSEKIPGTENHYTATTIGTQGFTYVDVNEDLYFTWQNPPTPPVA